ncbi:MAG: HipA domain-containing protein [Ignavibacteriales bacterium]|nr:HipA domain-containing protein [Ignavibacteriales bacterium]
MPEFTDMKLRASSRVSISGVQIKHPLKLEKTKLLLTESGGEYILKPVPHGTFLHLDQAPANEHLTMQIAKQLFNIETAQNASIYFSDGAPAYITKRFDISPAGEKYSVEDFAQIAQKSAESDGADYKYNYSYEGIADLIKRHVAASAIELEKFFGLVVFNCIISNGDAHLKNFSLFRNTEYGDYLLTPAYDLLCMRIYSPYESDMALDLFKDDYESESYKHGSKYITEDFLEFGKRLGIKPSRISGILKDYARKESQVGGKVTKSFLSPEIKIEYMKHFKDKCKRIVQLQNANPA